MTDDIVKRLRSDPPIPSNASLLEKVLIRELKRLHNEAADEIERLRTESDPQLIKTAPKDGRRISLYANGIWMAPCSWDGAEISETGAFWMWWVPPPEYFVEVENPTHWMPLPKSLNDYPD